MIQAPFADVILSGLALVAIGVGMGLWLRDALFGGYSDDIREPTDAEIAAFLDAEPYDQDAI